MRQSFVGPATRRFQPKSTASGSLRLSALLIDILERHTQTTRPLSPLRPRQARRALLPGWRVGARGPCHAHFQAVNAFAGSDEEQVMVLAAESDVGGPGFGHFDMFDLIACLVEDGDAAAGEINVAFVVERHA